MNNYCSLLSFKKRSFQNYFSFILSCLHFLLRNPFWIQLSYFIFLSFIGYLVLKMSMLQTSSIRLKSLDLFFMSASASTVSSMGTVEMENFSNDQLIILTLLMFLGGEVFLSLVELQLMTSNFTTKHATVNSVVSLSSSKVSIHEIELDSITHQEVSTQTPNSFINGEILKYKAIKVMGFVVLSYLLVFHIFGSCLIALYLYVVENSRKVLQSRGISIITFSIFTTVSTFTNCGFVPTNENMVVFKKNTGLLLLLIPQVLFGNTLYPLCLRLFIVLLEKITKRVEFSYMLTNCRELGYKNLLSRKQCGFLGMTVLGFIVIMFVGFCILEWNSVVMEGLSSYEKIVGALFVVVNSRHSGESVFDLSNVSAAILVLFVFMMYLPPYTYFSAVDDHDDDDTLSTYNGSGKEKKLTLLEKLKFSQISYLIIFTILICITERKKLKEDPLNFNVLNIIFEVTSAYGNVGFSVGYSCKKRLKLDGYCEDKYYGFVGKWSSKGKFILIMVMLFGSLKKFNMKGGRAWKLSA